MAWCLVKLSNFLLLPFTVLQGCQCALLKLALFYRAAHPTMEGIYFYCEILVSRLLRGGSEGQKTADKYTRDSERTADCRTQCLLLVSACVINGRRSRSTPQQQLQGQLERVSAQVSTELTN
jgi:hypothetical protein